MEHSPQGENHDETDDYRVIQDVLQCQLEDLESQLQRARKSLNLMEDQVQEKVLELSALEAKLVHGQEKEDNLHQIIHNRNTRIRELQDKETAIKNVLEEEKKRLSSECALLTKTNSELLQKVYKFRADERQKDLDLREKTQNIEFLSLKTVQLESDLRAKNEVIIELQVKSQFPLKTAKVLYLCVSNCRFVTR